LTLTLALLQLLAQRLTTWHKHTKFNMLYLMDQFCLRMCSFDTREQDVLAFVQALRGVMTSA